MNRKSRYNRLIAILLATAMIVGSYTLAFATTSAEKQEEAQEAQEQSQEAQEKADEAGEKAADMQGRIEEAIKKISAKNDEINAQTAKLEKTKQKQKKKKAEINTQEGLLNDRLETMYKTGTVGFVDVLLSSNSIDELITNYGMVQKILSNDKKILKDLRQDYEELDKLKKQQQEEESTLEAQKGELETMRAGYQEEADAYEAEQQQLQAEADSLAAEAAAAQKEAAKLLAKERAAAAANNGDGGGDALPSSGAFVWPCEGPITSYYGYRIHPIFGTYTYHSGYDIGAATGTPVLAAADGVVTMASYYGGYGNCVQIYIGGGYTTLYGHLSGFAVSNGAYVSKGQVVGYVGSTGWSTGPHLHYSLLQNGAYVDPMILY